MGVAGGDGEYLGNAGALEAGTLGAIYLTVLIGSVTFTGSVVAYSTLLGMMSTKALALLGPDQLNLTMLSVIGVGLAVFLDPSLGGSFGLESEFLQLANLGLDVVVSSILGFHLVALIGGLDMPVVVTVLNSYSGSVLVAGALTRTCIPHGTSREVPFFSHTFL